MKNVLRAIFFVVIICLAYSYAPAQKGRSKQEILAPKSYQRLSLTAFTDLDAMLKEAVEAAIDPANGKGFKPEEIAATLIDLRDPQKLRWGNFAGEKPIYPASVVKMFYMVALERQLEDGKLTLTPEVSRGLKDMIVDSSNEATQYILDVLTGTSSGSELPTKEFEAWQFKRNRVNRFFASMGYTNININQKTFCEDAYGIEQQSRKYRGENRNMITTNAAARLLAEIVLGRMNTPERTALMMTLLKRDPLSPATDPEDQAHAFTGKLFIDRKMTDARIWSKAGDTSKTRHDAAYIETADGLKFVLVIFTENHAFDKEPIPMIAGNIIDKLRKN